MVDKSEVKFEETLSIDFVKSYCNDCTAKVFKSYQLQST
jgi:hypothetical protein